MSEASWGSGLALKAKLSGLGGGPQASGQVYELHCSSGCPSRRPLMWVHPLAGAASPNLSLWAGAHMNELQSKHRCSYRLLSSAAISPAMKRCGIRSSDLLDWKEASWQSVWGAPLSCRQKLRSLPHPLFWAFLASEEFSVEQSASQVIYISISKKKLFRGAHSSY